MTTNDEQLHTKACLQEIEARLNWGPVTGWSNSDFERLAGQIADSTGILLSVTTLKRLWGKVASTHAPSLTTLNALAGHLGYAGWRSYQQQFRPPVHAVTTDGNEPAPSAAGMMPASTAAIDQEAAGPADTVSIIPPHTAGDPPLPAGPDKANQPAAPGQTLRRVKRRRLLLAGVTLLLALTVVGILSVKKLQRPDPSKFSFSINKVVAEGVPNTVVFHYDASAALTDSNYIVQTWDIRRKTHVPKDKHEHSAIYYYPGYFKTRLIADGAVVRYHDLLITSNGWLSLIENDPVPLYLKKEECLRNDSLVVDTAVLRRYGLSLYPEAPKLRIFNQRDLDSLSTDNFVFETKLKNNFSNGTGACQFVQVLIQCKDNIIIVPLAAKTCTGDISLLACGTYLDSKHADLSGFGADLHEWVTLHVEGRGQQMIFTVNGKEAYRIDYPDQPVGIVGLQYRFLGTGMIKDTWFRAGDRLYDLSMRN